MKEGEIKQFFNEHRFWLFLRALNEVYSWQNSSCWSIFNQSRPTEKSLPPAKGGPTFFQNFPFHRTDLFSFSIKFAEIWLNELRPRSTHH